MTEQILDWSLFGQTGTNLAGGGSLSLDDTQISIGFADQNGGSQIFTTDDPQYVADGEAFDPCSGLILFGSGGSGCGTDDTSRTVIDFAGEGGRSDNVRDVAFRINDLDVGAYYDRHIDIVTLRAWDADGNPVPVTITPSGSQIVSGNTITGNGEHQYAEDAEGSVLIEIAGPVSKIEIDYDNGDATDQWVWLTDIHFSTMADADGIVEGTTGDDLIDQSYLDDPEGDRIDAGDAILPGEAPDDDIVTAGDGDDTVLSGAGSDEVYGGAGRDQLFGGAGDDEIFGDSHGPRTLTFEDLTAGALVTDQFNGVTISSADPATPVMVFDTSNPTGGDHDLATSDLGNVLILSEDGDTTDPDDNAGGGTFIFDFESATEITELTLLDIEETGGEVRLFDADGDLIRSLDIPATSDGGQQVLDIRVAEVLRMEVFLPGSGAIDNISYTQVPLSSGDDDTLDGGEGADFMLGEGGDDLLRGGADNDTLLGGLGMDTLLGGDDRDTFIGGNGGDFVDGGAGGDDFDLLDMRGFKPAGGSMRLIIDGPDSNGNGSDGRVQFLDGSGAVTGTLDFKEIEQVIMCFTPGVSIATPQGEMLIEDLRAGDRVITRDNGLQEIRWIGSKGLTWEDFTISPHLRPIHIRPGALGEGLPEREMIVSPSHRLLVANDRTMLYFEEREVLVAAKHLVDNHAISQVDSVSTTYVHMLFDRHEVILANGAWTESFQPGDYTLNGVGNAQRNEIYELFPELKHQKGNIDYPAARMTLKRHEAKLLKM